MAGLPYTDGSNGNGITDLDQLIDYFDKYPIAWLDIGFVYSYMPLLKTNKKKAKQSMNKNNMFSMFPGRKEEFLEELNRKEPKPKGKQPSNEK